MKFKTFSRLFKGRAGKAPILEGDRYPGQQDFEAILSVVRKNSMLSRETLYSLYNQARYCEASGLDGDYVECGVWKGGAVGLMAMTNLRHGKSRRRIHLFDSFEEICEPDETVDGQRAIQEVNTWSKSGGTKGRLVPLTGVYDHMGGPGTLEENRDLLETRIGYPPDNLTYYKGWFQDTLPQCHSQIGDIAILRIDADWYASTKVCLDHLYKKVRKGGFVIIDDYGAYEGCRKAVDELISQFDAPVFLNPVGTDVRYWIV